MYNNCYSKAHLIPGGGPVPHPAEEWSAEPPQHTTCLSLANSSCFQAQASFFKRNPHLSQVCISNSELLLWWTHFDATSLRNQCLIFSDITFALKIYCTAAHHFLIYRHRLFIFRLPFLASRRRRRRLELKSKLNMILQHPYDDHNTAPGLSFMWIGINWKHEYYLSFN